MALKPKESRKIYYTMGEVCEMFDVNHSLIRFWVSKFDILKPHTNNKGNRLFTPKDVDNLKVIYHLVKERGMTLSGAARHMKLSGESLERDSRIIEHLSQLRAMMLELQKELTASESYDQNDMVIEVGDDYEPGVIRFEDYE